jgi:FkbM family methyltransferase
LEEQLARIELVLGRSLKSDHEYSLAATKNGYMLTFSNDMVIGKSLRDTGSFQEEDIEKAILLLEKNNLKVGRNTFLDVGSNIGTHTVHALRHGFRKALCIEADPDNFRLLKINQIMNDIDSRCFNICAAASNDSGEVEMELSPTNYGDHRIVIKQKHTKSAHAENFWNRKRIRRETLDEMIRSADIAVSEISFAWIDTQGHEGHVLSGARDFLASSTPFVAEFWPYGLERSDGWDLLRNVFEDSKREIFDLRRSIEAGYLVNITLEELDFLYDSWRKVESVQISPHTDLIVVRKA